MLLGGTDSLIAAWCGAAEARRKRAAEAVGLGPLYEAGEQGEKATACFWYGVGAMGQHVSHQRIREALAPTAQDVIAEAMGGVDFAARDAFALGLVAKGGDKSIKTVANVWVAATPAQRRVVAEAMDIDLGDGDPDEAATARVFWRLGEVAMERRDTLMVFHKALTQKTPGSTPPHARAPMTAANAGVNPWTVALNLRGRSLTTEVIPPPVGGILKGADGRTYRVKSMAALAAAIAAQSTAPRIDFDHRSERVSPTFGGSTRAEGWLSNFRVNARGGLDADLALGDVAAAAIERGEYRYLSPGLIVNKAGDITGLSSVALVNDPNFDLRVPAA